MITFGIERNLHTMERDLLESGHLMKGSWGCSCRMRDYFHLVL